MRALISDRKLSEVVNGQPANFTANLLQRYDYYPFGMQMPGRYSSAGARYRYGFNGKEQDREWGNGSMYDFGARMYDSSIGKWLAVDPLAIKYPELSPYNFVANSPINAIDPDGRLIIFVNGFRPPGPPMTGIPTKNRISTNDKHGYWGNIDNKFMDRLEDNNVMYFDGSSKAFSQADKNFADYYGRYNSGRNAGKLMIEKITSGEVELKQDETIKIVSHSQGSAYSAGMIKELTDAGYQVEVSYNIAPKQPGDIPETSEDRTVQYGSKWDMIAPQSPMKGAEENVKMPDDAEDGPIGGHLLGNYEWIFDIPEGQDGYVAPRKDVPVDQE